MNRTKLTPEQAAAKAFRSCRLNNDKSRKVASYIAKQHMLSSGCSLREAADAMPKIEELLNGWYSSRRGDPLFTPTLSPSPVTPQPGETPKAVNPPEAPSK